MHKASSFDTEENFRFFANLGYTEKSDKTCHKSTEWY